MKEDLIAIVFIFNRISISNRLSWVVGVLNCIPRIPFIDPVSHCTFEFKLITRVKHFCHIPDVLRRQHVSISHGFLYRKNSCAFSMHHVLADQLGMKLVHTIMAEEMSPGTKLFFFFLFNGILSRLAWFSCFLFF
jgi:hypothetical protein